MEILLTFKIKVMALNSAEKITKFLENVSVLFFKFDFESRKEVRLASQIFLLHYILSLILFTL